MRLKKDNAEKDPTLDIDGYDAVAKLVIAYKLGYEHEINHE